MGRKSIGAWVRRFGERRSQSIRIRNEPLIARFVADKNNTFLVSFPRTGSHWLRMLIELYFERPTLVRTFYYPDSTDFLILHTHDLDLVLERSNIIYLYRNPVDTVYSQLRYEREKLSDLKRIRYWADLYGRHLDKWLHNENFTSFKTILAYEEMMLDLAEAFEKVTGHFGQPLNRDKLLTISDQITKDEVKRKTRHDKQVVQDSERYSANREEFSHAHSQFVWDTILHERPYLSAFFVN